jgi:serine kinase of HPr protein (carbohydrate metabolism regulator)
MKISDQPPAQKKEISVGFLVEAMSKRFRLSTLNGRTGFENGIQDKNLHRPGLALAGYV